MSQPATTHDVYLPKIKQQVLQKLVQSDIKNKRIQTEQVLVDYFKAQRWWSINNGKALLDNGTGLLWEATPKATQYKYDQQDAARMNIGHILGLQNWQLPTAVQLEHVVKAEPKFPLRAGQNYEINNWWAWLTADKKMAKLNDKNISFGQFCDIDLGNYQVAKAIAVNDLFNDLSYIERIENFLCTRQK